MNIRNLKRTVAETVKAVQLFPAVYGEEDLSNSLDEFIFRASSKIVDNA